MLLNEGGDYSNTTGRFTCDNPGLYYFSVTLTKRRGTRIDQIYCNLYINGTAELFIQVNPTENEDYGSYSATTSGAFQLNRGETAYLGGCTKEESFDRIHSSFSGFLIKADIV